jgi:uncharacterized membrane protein YbhN (UPF0104 family)
MPGGKSLLLRARRTAGVVVFAASIVLLWRAVDLGTLAATGRAALADPAGIVLVVLAYAAAFGLRAVVWSWALPGLGVPGALAALHTSLAANHLLPFRLGEAVRVTDAVRRSGLPLPAATASTLSLRAADVVAVVVLAAVFAPAALRGLLGGWTPVLAGAGGAVMLAGAWWLRRTLGPAARRGFLPVALGAALAAWVLESAVLLATARWAGIGLDPAEAVLVTAVTIAAQVLAVAPGGIGTYEAAATTALAALGAPVGAALAAAVAAHALKTVYALATGAVAAVIPAPGLVGALRLPRRLPGPPMAGPAPGPGAPVVLFLPAHNEEQAVGEVVARAPERVCGHPVQVLVVDDGSSDATADVAAAAGARVLRHEHNRGLGAAVRTGMAEAVAMGAAAVAFCDADGEYAPEELERLVRPILDGEADYVAGSRFAGDIRHMRPHRRFGNVVLTAVLRWVARTPVTDGQTGYRAFSPAAAADAEILHDYNYAQVLTLDLIGKGYRYAEVPIGYAFRETGASFIKLGRYLRAVVPAVYRELNPTQV